MGPGGNTAFGALFLCVGASLALVVIGFVLRRRGKLETRGGAFLWAVLCLVPLFGAGATLFLTHMTEAATGVTRSGFSNDRTHPTAEGAPR